VHNLRGKMLLSNIHSWICCKIMMLLGNKKLSWLFVRVVKWYFAALPPKITRNCLSGLHR